MRVAPRALDLDAAHPMRCVHLELDRVLGNRLEEARPAGTRLELRVRPEQLGTARAAAEQAVCVDVQELTGEGTLRRGAAQDRVALGIELSPPLVVGLPHLLGHSTTT